MRRLLDTIERLVWLLVAAVIGGTWVAYEPLTGREIPGHAHPVFGALMAAALAWGGMDLRKTSYWHKKLLQLPPESLSPADVDRLAPKIAALESEDPLLVKAIQAAALRDAAAAAPRKRKTGAHRPVTRSPRRTPAPVNPEEPDNGKHR